MYVRKRDAAVPQMLLCQSAKAKGLFGSTQGHLDWECIQRV